MTQLPTSTCTGTPESTTAVEEASAQVLECPPPLFLQSGEERDCPAGCTYAEWTPRSGTGPCEAECSEGCQLFQLGNRECDRDCFTEACHFDSGDCNTCAPGCPWQYVQDGQCDPACFAESCLWDGDESLHGASRQQAGESAASDCATETGCARGCSPFMVGNGQCDEACTSAACGFDGGTH
jgi:hypothetical protein